jgi:hypothetical protein
VAGDPAQEREGRARPACCTRISICCCASCATT